MGKSTAAPANPYDDLELHPDCVEIPPMSDEEMGRVTEDIRRHGLLRKILKKGNQIIDGRSRWIILKNLGIPLGPEHFEEWDGVGSTFDLVMSLNAHRRHLPTGALAALAVKAKQRLTGTVPDARAAAAKLVGVAATYITAMERIQEADPALAGEVAAGRTTIYQAQRKAGLDGPRNGRNGHAAPDRALVEVKEPEHPTTLADIVEDHEERRAIREDRCVEMRVMTLDLAFELEGKVREAFIADAMAYCKAEEARKAYAATIGELMSGNRRSGPWLHAQERALACNAPEDWKRCPPVDRRKCKPDEEPGCGGSGRNGFGNETAWCGRCHGAGYTIR